MRPKATGKPFRSGRPQAKATKNAHLNGSPIRVRKAPGHQVRELSRPVEHSPASSGGSARTTLISASSLALSTMVHLERFGTARLIALIGLCVAVKTGTVEIVDARAVIRHAHGRPWLSAIAFRKSTHAAASARI